VKEEEYQEFYKHVAHDFETHWSGSHNKVRRQSLEYTSLLYVPAGPPFLICNQPCKRRAGLKAYVQPCVHQWMTLKQFLPLYLRFAKVWSIQRSVVERLA